MDDGDGDDDDDNDDDSDDIEFRYNLRMCVRIIISNTSIIYDIEI
jgi:hypothetical protein